MCEAHQQLLDLPPSAKLVFTVLDEEGPLTQQQIAEKTRLSSRTARYALTQLEEISAIEEQISFADARQKIYQLHCETSSE